MPTHKSFSTNQSHETLKQFSDSQEQDKSAQRHLMDAERRDFRHYQEIMDEEEKQNHPRNLDDRKSVDCDSDDHQYKDEIQKCQDNIEDLRAVIKRYVLSILCFCLLTWPKGNVSFWHSSSINFHI